MDKIKVVLSCNPEKGIGKETPNKYRYEFVGKDPSEDQVEKVAQAMELSEGEAVDFIKKGQDEPEVNTIYIRKDAFDNPDNPPRELKITVEEV